jgi:geranylgeranyl pyrophosphate synthase
MNLETYMQQVKTEMEHFLNQWLVPDRIPSSRLMDAMQYCLFGGGKRIRPCLAAAAAKAIRGSTEYPLPTEITKPEILLGAALESIHTYSLVHDDLPCMDDDALRRGRPTCHIAYDEATAVLAGDALLNLGFEILLEGVLTFGPRMARAAEVIARAAGMGGMVSGQMLDLEGMNQTPTPALVETIHRNKTGALLHAAVLSGGIVAGADEHQEVLLSRFGKAIGLAFQIVDDLLDLTETSKNLGKSAGKDSQQNKMTYPVAFGMDKSREMAETLTTEAESILNELGPHTTELQGLANLILCRDH